MAHLDNGTCDLLFGAVVGVDYILAHMQLNPRGGYFWHKTSVVYSAVAFNVLMVVIAYGSPLIAVPALIGSHLVGKHHWVISLAAGLLWGYIYYAFLKE